MYTSLSTVTVPASPIIIPSSYLYCNSLAMFGTPLIINTILVVSVSLSVYYRLWRRISVSLAPREYALLLVTGSTRFITYDHILSFGQYVGFLFGTHLPDTAKVCVWGLRHFIGKFFLWLCIDLFIPIYACAAASLLYGVYLAYCSRFQLRRKLCHCLRRLPGLFANREQEERLLKLEQPLATSFRDLTQAFTIHGERFPLLAVDPAPEHVPVRSRQRSIQGDFELPGGHRSPTVSRRSSSGFSASDSCRASSHERCQHTSRSQWHRTPEEPQEVRYGERC